MFSFLADVPGSTPWRTRLLAGAAAAAVLAFGAPALAQPTPATGRQVVEQPGPDGAPAPAATKRLGYLSFDANERSGHQARELKSVHVSIDAAALRLVVHRCHVNKLNIYNQVGQGGLGGAVACD